MSAGPSFEVEGRDWPNREASRFVREFGMTWHVQIMGSGPGVLLLHGTGASTHSWAGMAPILARDFTLVMPDLPGHGFSTMPDRARMSLPGMAALTGALLRRLDLPPIALGIGHSAGAAILMRMALDGRIAPRALVSLNGALQPLPAGARTVFPLAARLVAATPGISWLVARQAVRRANVDRLLDATGSRIDPQSARRYAMLLAAPRHVGAALAMMSRWDLPGLALEQVGARTLLLAGADDRMVPPADARAAAARMPAARTELLDGLGHLAHEEQPALVAAIARDHLLGQAGGARPTQALCA